MSFTVEQSDIHYFSFGANFLAESSLWDDLRTPLGRAALLSAFKPASSLQPSPFIECRDGEQLRSLFASEYSSARLEESMAQTPPPAYFQIRKGDQSWGEWLSLPPETGGISDSDYLELLSWNLAETKSRNKDIEENVSLAVTEYSENLAAQISDGRLAPSLGRIWDKKKKNLKVVVSGPLAVASGNIASYYSRHNVIVFAPEGLQRQDARCHEFTHATGRLANPFLNEGMTSLIESQVADDKQPSAYIFTERVIQSLLGESGISLRALSHCFSGTHKRRNEAAIRGLTKGTQFEQFSEIASQISHTAINAIGSSHMVHQTVGLYLAHLFDISAPAPLIEKEYAQYGKANVESFKRNAYELLQKLEDAVQRTDNDDLRHRSALA